MKHYVIIAAGGNGTRFGADKPKQFLLLQNKPILIHTLEKFAAAIKEVTFIIALPEDYMVYTESLINEYKVQNAQLVIGGATRFHSVQNALNTITDDNSIVLVHDAARCLISTQLIQNCIAHTINYGNAIPTVTCADSVRWVSQTENKILDRNHIKLVQTPQTFITKQLKTAFTQQYNSSFTDEASVVALAGFEIHIIDGEYSNIKITTPIDLKLAQVYLEK
jgi:2-C-methyl-D-erythritol 4-phosphate cytidylyltransferase